jgi:hypothetical protein
MRSPMKLESLPDTIQAIATQAGGPGLRGAFLYVGAHNLTYHCPEPAGEYRPSYPSRLASEGSLGFVDYKVGLQCLVNGQRGHRWTLIIAYEPKDDTHTVWLVEGHRGRKPDSMVLACVREVFCDALRGVIEAVYGLTFREHIQGFIPVP